MLPLINENKYSFSYLKEYTMEIFVKPGKWCSSDQLRSLHETLKGIDHQGMQLNYGILDGDIDPKKQKTFFEKTIIVIFYKKKEPVGFFYNYILSETIPALHMGLLYTTRVLPSKLTIRAYAIVGTIAYALLGRLYYITNISHIPWAVGQINRYYSNTWPTYKNYASTPPDKYLKILKVLEKKYIRLYFDKPEKVEIDYDRFVVREKDAKFARDFNLLKKDRDQKNNRFCQKYLDYTKEEDLIQVARVKRIHYLFSIFWVAPYFISNYFKKKTRTK